MLGPSAALRPLAVVLLALLPALASAKFGPSNPPPLLPNELLAFTRGGCGVILVSAPPGSGKQLSPIAASEISRIAAKASLSIGGWVNYRDSVLDVAGQAAVRGMIAEFEFAGDCSTGLAHGKGHLEQEKSSLPHDLLFHHGRVIRAGQKDVEPGYETRISQLMQPVVAAMDDKKRFQGIDPELAAAIRDEETKLGKPPASPEATRVRAIEIAAARKLEAARAAALAASSAAEAAKKGVAERERADKAYVASLTKLGPGALFNLADTKRREGDTDKERQALRALIGRFPNHAMAGAAAQQLSRIPDAPASANSPPGEAAKPLVDDMAAVMGGGKK